MKRGKQTCKILKEIRDKLQRRMTLSWSLRNALIKAIV